MIRRSDLCGHTYRATPCSTPHPSLTVLTTWYWSLLPALFLVQPGMRVYLPVPLCIPPKHTQRGEAHALPSASRVPCALSPGRRFSVGGCFPRPSVGCVGTDATQVVPCWQTCRPLPAFGISDSTSMNNLVQMSLGTCAGVLKSGFAVWKSKHLYYLGKYCLIFFDSVSTILHFHQ